MGNRELLKAQMEAKNVGIALVLTLFFGGLGLLYASIPFGLVMVAVEIIVLIIGLLTMGLGLILFIPLHIFCVVMAIVLVKRHNAKVLGKFSE